jgi:hypothetical protein
MTTDLMSYLVDEAVWINATVLITRQGNVVGAHRLARVAQPRPEAARALAHTTTGVVGN